MLDASVPGQPLFEQLGFHTVCKINDWVGMPNKSGDYCPELTANQLETVIAYDRPRFGADRSRVLSRLVTEFPELSRADMDSRGVLRGYLLGYQRRKAIQIGPWLHENVQGAERLFSSVIESCNGQTLLVRVPNVNPNVAKFLRSVGLRQADVYTRMILGNVNPIGQWQSIYAIAGLAVG
jgi:hypothetical protein